MSVLLWPKLNRFFKFHRYFALVPNLFMFLKKSFWGFSTTKKINLSRKSVHTNRSISAFCLMSFTISFVNFVYLLEKGLKTTETKIYYDFITITCRRNEISPFRFVLYSFIIYQSASEQRKTPSVLNQNYFIINCE